MSSFFNHPRTSVINSLLITALLWSWDVSAKTPALNDLSGGVFKDPFYLLFFLIGIALLPFLAVMTTSFSKIVIVLSIARLALGTSQTPPNIVIMSLAIVLTCFSMYPVGLEIYNAIDHKKLSSSNGADAFIHLADSAKGPMRRFLTKYAKPEDRALFADLMKKQEGPNQQEISEHDFIILAPAFLISELSSAFQIGFLIYLPFLVIDMTVANLLMALGMQMLAPTTISLPFKILLFVLVDGWRMISEGLVKGLP